MGRPSLVALGASARATDDTNSEEMQGRVRTAPHHHDALDEYELGPQTHQGLDGRIFRARRRDPWSQADVVVKVARSRATDHLVETEALLLARFAHPHLVRVLARGALGGRAAMVLEAATCGTLADARGRLDENAAVAAVLDVLDGLCALHGARIAHLDVKPQNVLLTHDAHGLVHAQVADLARAVRLEHGAHPTARSERYAAPELLRRGAVGPATDVYSVGVLARELGLGQRYGAWLARASAPDPCVRFAHAGAARGALLALAPPEPALRDALTRCAGIVAVSAPASTYEGAGSQDATVPFERGLEAAPSSRPARAEPTPGPGLLGVRRAPLLGRDAELRALLAHEAEVRAHSVARLVRVRGPEGAGTLRLAQETTGVLASRGAYAATLPETLDALILEWVGARTTAEALTLARSMVPEPHAGTLVARLRGAAASDAAAYEACAHWLATQARREGLGVVVGRSTVAWHEVVLARTASLRAPLLLLSAGPAQATEAAAECALAPLPASTIDRILRARGADGSTAARHAAIAEGLPGRAIALLERDRSAVDAWLGDDATDRAVLARLTLGPCALRRHGAVRRALQSDPLRLTRFAQHGVYAPGTGHLALGPAHEHAARVGLPPAFLRRALREVRRERRPAREALGFDAQVRLAQTEFVVGAPRRALRRLVSLHREVLDGPRSVALYGVLHGAPTAPSREPHVPSTELHVDSTSPERAACLALCAFLRGDSVAARALAEGALAHATDPTVRRHLLLTAGQAALSVGDRAAARSYARQVRASGGRNAGADALRAVLLEARVTILDGNPAAAQAPLSRALRDPRTRALRDRAPDLVLRALSLLADACANGDEPARAIALCDRVVRGCDRHAAPAVRLVALNTQVDALLKRGDFARAVERGLEALRGAAEGPVAMYLRGNVAVGLVRAGRAKESVALVDEALDVLGDARHRLWAYLASVRALALSHAGEHTRLEAWLATLAPHRALLEGDDEARRLLAEARPPGGPW